MDTPAAPTLEVRRFVEHVMGMPISLALRGPGAYSSAARTAWTAVRAELTEVDRVFSTYRSDSYVSRLARGEIELADCPVEVVEVLGLGRRAEAESDGAFSIMLPDGAGGRRLDPSGVVKGWAVQRASRHLAAVPDTDFCLSAGGDMVCRVVAPDRPAWRIGIEDPRDPSRVLAVVPVRTAAVATSGTAQRGEHLLDPRTGGVAQGPASVTVVAPDLTWADIDATAAYVLGERAVDWLGSRPLTSALVVWSDGSTNTVDGRRRRGPHGSEPKDHPTVVPNSVPIK
ncbi:ApbE family protein [Microlunatus phosphovorus NM-1]|uniref:FAD:protein FMN transferase n=1 Tax=Microlunatus phosphovorus (strain ATCC 700054 / DSM 10555 / JCM 9379 / NBRC 101784 / NCIMB 13414 / VKM Ac-1990 / NM-1) TaxID=1032480 RepID=F5XGC5_MICPN|nr:FAD:protein FMN transferase [Microlunatus phosphovorus]BAK33032.1 ApbE family protein [Microlunatus phosphovorus NM-1]